MTNCIRIWRWADAPEKYRRLSWHGGDEDYVAHIPAGLEWMATFFAEGTWFGCSGVQEIEQPDGSLVLIGAHA